MVVQTFPSPILNDRHLYALIIMSGIRRDQRNMYLLLNSVEETVVPDYQYPAQENLGCENNKLMAGDQNPDTLDITNKITKAQAKLMKMHKN